MRTARVVESSSSGVSSSTVYVYPIVTLQEAKFRFTTDKERVGSSETKSVTGEPILCIDDDPAVRKVIARVLDDGGHRCMTAGDVDEARHLIAENDYSVVLCDIGLPGESGLELLAELAHTPAIATVMVTGRDDPDIADLALELGAYGYLTKPFAPNDLLINIAGAVQAPEARRSARRPARASRTAQPRRLRGRAPPGVRETVARLGRAIEYHDVETGDHVERVAASAHAIAARDRPRRRPRRAGAPREPAPRRRQDRDQRGDPPQAGRAHGRRAARDGTAHEVGHTLLAGSGNELLELAATIAWTHHENWDGSGYPSGLAGEDIPLAGRIVAVADVFDALTTDRPYRRAWSEDDAFAYVEQERGRKFDPDIVEALGRRLGRRPQTTGGSR